MVESIYIEWISYTVNESVKVKFSINKCVNNHPIILAKLLSDNIGRILSVSPTALDNLNNIGLETHAGKEVRF